MSTLLKNALDQSGHQIQKCFEGFPADAWDAKPIPGAMSAREILAHLWECYYALDSAMDGKSHAWGEFEVPAEIMANPINFAWAKRDESTARALASADPKHHELAIDYVALHDAYHVGQMVTLRSAVQPDWNSYSIYPGH